MITDDDVFRLFAEADPARDEPTRSLDLAGDLAALRTRSNDMTVIETERDNAPAAPRRWPIYVAAAAVVAVIVGGLVLASRDDETEPTPATEPTAETEPTSPAGTTIEEQASEPAIVPEAAIEQALALLRSFPGGDIDAVEAQLDDDFEMAAGYGGGVPRPVGNDDSLNLPHQVATAVRYEDPTCDVVESDSEGVVVRCEAATKLDVHQVTNTEGEPTTIVITVGRDGVTSMTSSYPNFGPTILRTRDEWVELNRPDAEWADEVELTDFATYQQMAAQESAILTEWVAFGVDVAERALATVNAGTVDDFLTRLAAGNDVLGVPADSAPDVFAAMVANGVRFEPSSCGPNGIREQTLVIACEVDVTGDSLVVAGVEAGGSIELGVGADGIIEWHESTIDWVPVHEFNRAFEAWLASEAPDAHARTTWVDLVTGGDVRSPLALDPSGDHTEIIRLIQVFVDASPDDPNES